MDILEFTGELELALFNFPLDLPQPGFNLDEFLLGEETGVHLSARVRDGARYIVREKTPIVGDRLSITLHQIGSLLCEASLPHDRSFWFRIQSCKPSSEYCSKSSQFKINE